MTELTLLGLASFFTYLATKAGSALLVRIGAVITWVFVMWYYVNNPPFGLAAGSAGHNMIAIFLPLVMMVTCMLVGWKNKYRQTLKYPNSNKEMNTEGYGWKLPEWLKGLGGEEDNTYEAMNKRMEESNEDYRSQLRRAYKRKGYKN